MSSGDEPRLPVPRAEREIGWYRDPGDAKTHRYWNGRRWSRRHPEPGGDEEPCAADC